MKKLSSAEVKKLGDKIKWDKKPEKKLVEAPKPDLTAQAIQSQGELVKAQTQAVNALYGAVITQVKNKDELIEVMKEVNIKPKEMVVIPKRDHRGLAESYTIKINY